MGKSRTSQRRALSAGQALWQSAGKTAGVALALVFATVAFAAPGGRIGTLPIGDYACELPGDATGAAGLRQPAEDFAVVNASSYRAAGAMGSYLLSGDRLTMTSGPHRGKRYRRLSDGFLRLIGGDGEDSVLRCIRRKRNNS